MTSTLPPLAKVSGPTNGEQRDGPDAPTSITVLPPTTPLNLRARENDFLDRLQVEKVFFEPDAASPGSNLDAENGTTGARSYKLNPLQRVAETVCFLLPVMAAVYLLASCCVPTSWWREHLSIVNIALSVKQDSSYDKPSLLIGAFGWCIQEATEGTRCSRAKFTYSLDDFFALEGYGEAGPPPSAFVTSTMRAFVSLIPSALLTCAAVFFVLLHVYRRCLQNDRRREAGKWQHLVIFSALLSTIAFSVVLKVFAIQLVQGMAEDFVVRNGTVPTLVRISIILLSIALAASVIPPFVARARSQYMYHVHNMQAKAMLSDGSKQKSGTTCSSYSDLCRNVEQDLSSDRSVVNRLTLMVGKRATRLFGPLDIDRLVLEDNIKKVSLSSPILQEPPRSAIREEADPNRKSVLKRLTLKTQTINR